MDIHQEKRISRMNRVDSFSPEIRALVYKHGLTVVDAFLAIGINKPKHIRHLIGVVRSGSVEIGNRTDNPMIQTPKTTTSS